MYLERDAPEITVLTPTWHADSFQEMGQANASSVAITKPTGTVEGNLILLCVTTQWGSTMATTPAGFTLIARYDSTSSNCPSVEWYYKIAGDSEPDDYTFTFTAGTIVHRAFSVRITNFDPINPIGPHSGITTNTTSVNTIDIPSITTTVEKCLLIGTRSHSSTTSTSISIPDGWTSRSSVSGVNSVQVATGETGVAGATGDKTFTWTTARRVTAMMFAVNGITTEEGTTQLLQYDNLPDLTDGDFSVTGWFKKTSEGGTPMSLCILDDSDDLVATIIMGTAADNTIVGNIYNTDDEGAPVTTFSGANSFRNEWVLVNLNWTESTQTLSLNVVYDGIPSGLSDSAVLGGRGVRTAAKIRFADDMPGHYGCIAIRERVFTLSDAVNMYNSKRRHAPWLYDNASLNENGVIVFNHGVALFPSSAESQSGLTGARIGSPVTTGRYLVYRRGVGVDNSGSQFAVRPVTTEGLVYKYESDDEGFFEIETSGSVEAHLNSPLLKRWAINEPITRHMIATWGNSRNIRQFSYPASPTQAAEPFSYACSFFSGLALHHLDNLSGVFGLPPQTATGNRKWPGYDFFDEGAYTSGTVSVNVETDFRRLWLHSSGLSAPSRITRLGNDGLMSAKVRNLPGSKIDNSESLVISVTYLRAPGCSDIQYRLVEADAHDEQGDNVGDEFSTNDANTTMETHGFAPGLGDSYNAGTRTLVINDYPLSGIAIGNMITIVDGTGAGQCAQIEDVVETLTDYTITLKHAFGTAPQNASVLAFGPWEYATVSLTAPSSAKEFRGLQVRHDGNISSNEVGAHILSYNCWRDDVPGFVWGCFGWGGNGYTPQTEETFTDVPRKICEHFNVDTAILTDAYQGSSPLSENFPPFAALIQSAGTEPVWLVGQSNSIDGSSEISFRNMAVANAYPALIVTGSPHVGSRTEYTAYGGIEGSNHPSIECFVNVAKAAAELAEQEFELDTIPEIDVSTTSVVSMNIGMKMGF